MKLPLSEQRRDYSQSELSETTVAAHPLDQLEAWLDAALQAQLADATAMTLATVGMDQQPSARIVLLKDLEKEGQGGLTWFTNYQSRKGVELSQTPRAALLFFWSPLERQVRIEGQVERLTRAQSESYFHSRPLSSRIGAWASHQSQAIADKEALDARVEHFQQQWGETPPCPAYWGGYRLVPEYFEFWQGRPSRLHDRIVYRSIAKEWSIERLQP